VVLGGLAFGCFLVSVLLLVGFGLWGGFAWWDYSIKELCYLSLDKRELYLHTAYVLGREEIKILI